MKSQAPPLVMPLRISPLGARIAIHRSRANPGKLNVINKESVEVPLGVNTVELLPVLQLRLSDWSVSLALSPFCSALLHKIKSLRFLAKLFAARLAWLSSMHRSNNG